MDSFCPKLKEGYIGTLAPAPIKKFIFFPLISLSNSLEASKTKSTLSISFLNNDSILR